MPEHPELFRCRPLMNATEPPGNLSLIQVNVPHPGINEKGL